MKSWKRPFYRPQARHFIPISIMTALMVMYTNCGQLKTNDFASQNTSESVGHTWNVGDWGACSATMCGTTGIQLRTIQCLDSDSQVVDDVFCTAERPESTRACSSAACVGCNLPASLGGGMIAHDATVTAYQAATVPNGQTCQSQTRRCDNGTLSGSYTFATCTVQGSTTNPCTLDGVTVQHGSSRNFFSAASVACGQTCQSQSRTCNNGVLSGSDTFNRAACAVAACASCSRPWGGTVAHGDQITAFQNATVPSGQTCQSQQRTCNNGTLSGSYVHQNCSVQTSNPGALTFAFDQYLNGSTDARYFGLQVADFTGDGRVDILFTDHNDGRYNRYWRGNGNGTFTELNTATYGAGQSSPERGSLWTKLIDFDFDGDLDWFWDDVSPASLRINNGTGTFTSYYAATNQGRIVGFSRYQNQPVMAVLTVTGRIISGQAILNGTFGNLPANSPLILGQASCSAPVGFDGAPICRTALGISESEDLVRMQSMVYTDLDGDGDNDLAFFYGGSFENGVVRVYRNNGSGSFTLMGTLPNSTLVGAFSNYATIVSADMNGDGRKDLIVPGTTGGYRIYINEGGFSFSNPVTFNDDPQYNSHWGEPAIGVGDYTGDGKPDVVLINGHRVKLYRNTSN